MTRATLYRRALVAALTFLVALAVTIIAAVTMPNLVGQGVALVAALVAIDAGGLALLRSGDAADAQA